MKDLTGTITQFPHERLDQGGEDTVSTGFDELAERRRRKLS